MEEKRKKKLLNVQPDVQGAVTMPSTTAEVKETSGLLPVTSLIHLGVVAAG
jgi:hypothetical protein